MAPVAKAEALTCKKKGLVGSGWRREGLARTVAMRVFNAFLQAGVQLKECSFFVSSVSGLAIVV